MYAIPFRKSAIDKGEKRVDQAFDHTAMDAAFRFAGKVQQDLWPAGQQNFTLKPGPLVKDQATRDALDKQLQDITEVVQAGFENGDWDMAFHEMALELSAGTGAILMLPPIPGDSERLWDPINVPIDELYLESGPRNRISGIYWTRKMSYRVLAETYPDGKFNTDLKKLISEKPEDDLVVFLDTIWDTKQRRWMHYVWVKDQKQIIHTRSTRTCPWLTPRYFRVPGETYGRGVINLAMPTIKTTNTAQRLQLQAAAIAMLGIYTVVDDGVFNPDLAALEPGAFWKVSRNGGPSGPSVSRFPDPRLDLSGIVIDKLQMGIKATMMDQSLPPDGASVRSATEILERVKRLASDHIGAYGRLVREIVMPAIKHKLEIDYERGLIDTDLTIDQLIVSVQVESPIAMAREAQRVEKIINWLQMLLATYAQLQQPGRTETVAKIDELLADMGKSMGVPAKYIFTTEERTQKAQEQQKQELAMAMAQAGAPEGDLAV